MNNAEAEALRHWLITQEPGLAKEIFLDRHEDLGIAVGTKWTESLNQAMQRCEAIICLISDAWLESAECQAEFRAARYLGKRMFCARLHELSRPDVSRDWQRCDLFGGPAVVIRASESTAPVELSIEGLHRLLSGLRAAGVAAANFPWPPERYPDRSPYRGWQPFDRCDAGVYFGRDAQIVRALDRLRTMRESRSHEVLAVLGPSGTGKSSFLKAGLLPRLARDDRSFLVLGTMRPRTAPLTGPEGLAASIYDARCRMGLAEPSLGEIAAAIPDRPDMVRDWLRDLETAMRQRLHGTDDHGAPPTLILPIDQAEELFGTESGPESARLLELLPALTQGSEDAPRLIVVLTIRTDRYERYQIEKRLGDVRTFVFDELKPMPRSRFQEVITGPASRASESGNRLTIQPALLDQLLEDCGDGADTLPLLALTLSRLYHSYASTGTLTVENYRSMGALSRIVQTEMDALLGHDPETRRRRLESARAAFIPWLVSVDRDGGQPLRRVARWRDLPDRSHGLIDEMVDARLMVKDVRGGEVTVEVAVESLLRTWDDLAGWIREKAGDLAHAEALESFAHAWERGGFDEEWLLRGTRLIEAESLAAAEDFRNRLSPLSAFLSASRQRENSRAADEAQRREAEMRAVRERARAAEDLAAAKSKAASESHRYAVAMRRRSRMLTALALALVLIATVAVIGFVQAETARNRADQQARAAIAARMIEQNYAMLRGGSPGGDIRFMPQALAALALAPSPTTLAAAADIAYAREHLAAVSEVGWVRCVAFLPPGDRVLWGGEDGLLRVRGAGLAASGEKTQPAHDGVVRGVAVDPSGTRVVSVGDDGKLKLWDARSLELITERNPGQGPILSVAYSRDGDQLVTGGADGKVRLWDSRLKQTREWPAHTGAASSVAFGKDRKQIASGGTRRIESPDGTVTSAGSVWTWDLETDRALRDTEEVTEPVRSVALSPNGRWLAFGLQGGLIARVGLQSPSVRVWRAHNGPVYSVAFSADSQWIATGGGDARVRLWAADTEPYARDGLSAGIGSIWAVAFSPDGRHLAAGGDDSLLRSWDTTPSQLIPATDVSPVTSVAAGPNGLAASGDDAGTVRLWSVPDRRLVTALPTPGGAVQGIAVSPDGAWLVAAGSDGRLRLWDTRSTESPPKDWLAHTKIRAVTFAGKDSIVSGGEDGVIRVWRIDGTQLREWSAHTGTVTTLASSGDGGKIVSGGSDGAIRQWDPRTGAQAGAQHELAGASIHSIAYSPDASLITWAIGNSTVWLWDQHGDPVILYGHTGTVQAVAFDSQGKWAVSGGNSAAVRLWDVKRRAAAGEGLQGDSGGTVIGLAYSPDARWFVAGDRNGTVRIWRTYESATELTERICGFLTANPSRKNWREWVSPDIDYIRLCPSLPVAEDGG